MASIIKTYLNDIYQDVRRRANWNSINPDYQFLTVAGQQDYILPTNFGKEMYVLDATNNIPLPFISLEELVDKFPTSLSVQGSLFRYSIFDKNVRSQPTSASTLSLASSNSGDTADVRIRGANASGIEYEETVTLNGITPVPSVNSYTEIRSISKSGATTGYITITSNGAAVTIAVLNPVDVDYKVKALRFHYIPSLITTIKMPYHIEPEPLVNDYDVPVFNCADVLELGATAKAWRYKRQFQKAGDFDVLYEKGIIQLMWNDANQPNQTHLLNPKPYDRNYV